MTPDYVVSLETLNERYEPYAAGRKQGDSGAAYAAILERLAENRRLAEATGWTRCALARRGRTGRLYLEGTPPGGTARQEVPDLARGAGGAAADRLEHSLIAHAGR